MKPRTERIAADLYVAKRRAPAFMVHDWVAGIPVFARILPRQDFHILVFTWNLQEPLQIRGHLEGVHWDPGSVFSFPERAEPAPRLSNLVRPVLSWTNLVSGTVGGAGAGGAVPGGSGPPGIVMTIGPGGAGK